MTLKLSKREFITRAVLTLTATVIGLFFLEIAVRIFYPTSIMNVEVGGGGDELFITDETLGIRPAFGTSMYDKDGILFSRSIFSTATAPRKILFIGDSVTVFARIIEGLVDLIGSKTTSGSPGYTGIPG